MSRSNTSIVLDKHASVDYNACTMRPAPEEDRLFIRSFPAGISYADREPELLKRQGIDPEGYSLVAFLSAKRMELSIYDPDSPLLERVLLDSADRIERLRRTVGAL